MHGGRIWAESGEAGRGTRFNFTLPVAEDAADAAPSPPRRPRGPRKGEERTCILVVDDDPQMLRYVRDALAEADYAPVTTADPEQLAALIRTHKPRLVLLDLVLPSVDGIALMQGTRELEDLPVVFISAYDRDETIVRALDAGAADYIVKPFTPTELTARVRAALRRRAEPQPFLLGELAIHYEDRRVTVDGRPVTLTLTEFEVLRVLSANAGRVVTYESLLRQAWGARDRGSTDPKLVRAIVKTLPQAGRRRGQPRLPVQRARRGLPHGAAAGAVRPSAPHPASRALPNRKPERSRFVAPACVCDNCRNGGIACCWSLVAPVRAGRVGPFATGRTCREGRVSVHLFRHEPDLAVGLGRKADPRALVGSIATRSNAPDTPPDSLRLPCAAEPS